MINIFSLNNKYYQYDFIMPNNGEKAIFVVKVFS